MINFRSQFLGLGACLLGSAAVANTDLTCTEIFASQRMSLVVPNAPGGGYDTYARALAPALERLGEFDVRVVNMPASGGQAARNLTINASDDDLVLLIENTADLAITEIDGSDAAGEDRRFLIEQLDVLGIVHAAEVVWVGSSALDLSVPREGGLVGADGTVEEAVFSLFMPALALGLQSDLVTGYDGTNDQVSGVLRGEIDVMNVSVTSGLRVATDENLKIVLSLSDGPSAAVPDAPYLAGEGSLTWQLTEDLDDAVRTERRQIAQAVADLKSETRGLHMSRNISEERRACMAEVIAQALEDPEFVENATAQGRPVEIMKADAARQLARNMVSSMKNVTSLSDAIIQERSVQ
jgi:tripartite-type tricarboxylate transporter receptor subunit TctC